MNRKKEKKLKIIISIVITILIILAISDYYSIMYNNQKSLPINHKINTNNLKIIENKNVLGNSDISLILEKNATELLLIVYSNDTSGNIELINPWGHIEISIPLHKGSNCSESLIH